MEGVLIECVQSSLRHLLYRNAIFMCERLCSEFPSETNLQLLAACYLQSNQAYSAYHILKGTQMPQSRYLFAISCYQMDLLNEAEMALCPSNEPSAEVPNGAAGHYLLGLIYRYTDRLKSAAHQFNQALSIDPLLWVAYEELCKLGAAGEATTVFGESASECIQKQYISHDVGPQLQQASSDDHNVVSGRQQVAENVSARQLRHSNGSNIKDNNSLNHNGAVFSGNTVAAAASQSNNGVHTSISYYNTPSPMATQLSGVAPPPICRNVLPSGPTSSSVGADVSPRSTVKSTIQAPRRKFVDEGKLRKISGRLFSDSVPRRSTRLAGEGGPTASTSGVAVAAGNGTSHSSKYPTSSKLGSAAFRSVTVRKGQSWATETSNEGARSEIDDSRLNTIATTSGSSPSLDTTRSCEHDGSMGRSSTSVSKVGTGALEVLSLLKIIGEGYRLSCLYRCQDALDVFQQLPLKHYNTAWVLSQVGKAHFELVDYIEAERAFSNARLASPYSLEGMDVYSTVLYHLKEDMRLSYLAQELISTDRLAPQSWCAMGNCYSMQKDHETALKNFQRAVQLNSRFTYAHTLCGHEYVALEDFENGIKSYHNALKIDARHYNAWYGLAMIYLRQEKYEFSEHHFRRALNINPCSSVIMSYLGTSLHALKRNEEALAMMEKAIIADKKNPLPMYQKANILASMEDYDGALVVLQELKEYAPHESSVYALMGKIYKKRLMYDMAMLHFGLALDLKPSATDVATIKAAIEKLHVPDELEDNL
ncbi:putative tetratricopeptide-like helical domain superfamily, acetyltransferase A, auxiliary subunit [Helianthus annuus]|uniref:Putative CDC27 family protein n=1 Tax=Helianthus annuus TaxID=4232 RepID=A0A251UZD7_HELAN|nr:cell division cycle protein 27 homolog B [Helianthus annuus]XP_022035142.1 cell division cycle protein 27 homolog B [Helianthus annuus]KAF5810721.1 putative tetratricopeptide-like helical domain superfamily, acetyltransferase A, auxiliary subunit [Helianthus annuus]KAJ0581495.1 putative tetratricopeptide-like helical domain superfamily [Helianthus annuus]KAJ0589459.1 putative tetratricopeptide-like helical domain superfamily [Helianthus annuus]KAJ0758103.1 putative tetratricopeptide-like he